ncbi:MAG: FAD-binding oxidoreductase, partial [Desulfatiglandales bacterium]
MEPRVYKALMGIVGPLNVCEDESLMAQYGSDATKLFFKPDLVLFPSHSKEVAEVLKLANVHRFPVIPRGAGTGMSGGALPVSGGVVLEFGKMNRILDMDPKDGLCEVEPGAKTHEVQMEAKKLGLYYPPDPASAKESTIGGNIAECAG